jgi:hypothetical protein
VPCIKGSRGVWAQAKSAGTSPEQRWHIAGIISMEVNPRPTVVKKLKEQADAEGLTLNAYLTPFLNDIAAGRLVRVPHYPPPAQQQAGGKLAA